MALSGLNAKVILIQEKVFNNLQRNLIVFSIGKLKNSRFQIPDTEIILNVRIQNRISVIRNP